MTAREKRPRRDIEKTYPKKQFVAKLRHLADCIEQGKRFRIQVAGERVSTDLTRFGGHLYTRSKREEMLTDAGNDPPYPPEFKLEAVRLVKAALTLFGLEEDGEEIPAASDPSTLDLNQPGAFVTLVSVYMSVVRAEMAHQFVRKTVTLPKWLNDVAETAGINFSRSLQTAIRPEGIASGLD